MTWWQIVLGVYALLGLMFWVMCRMAPDFPGDAGDAD